MEVWLSLLIGLLSIAVTIGMTGWQLSRTMERVTMAIHEDIKRSQEKLAKEIEEE